jgi:RHS repeat-associated protein
VTKHSILLATIVLLSLLTTLAHASTVTYVYTDPQGTPLIETDTSGNITAQFDYTPYGVPAVGAGPDGVGYTGHVNDPETGLVYMQARYYAPDVARFASVDPVGPVPGDVFSFNRYGYANNNPSVNIDPDGTTCTRSGASENYTCYVDKNDGGFTDDQIKKVNKAYTDTVGRLNSHPNASVTVTMEGKSFLAKSGDVAKALIGAKVVTSSKSSTARADTLGGGITSSSNYHLDYQPLTTIYKNAVTTDRSGGTSNIMQDLAKTFAHEGLHMIPRENTFKDIYLRDPAKFQIMHRDEYNKDGDLLYGRGN